MGGPKFGCRNRTLHIILNLILTNLSQKTPKWVFARVAAIETICTILLNYSEFEQKFFENFCWSELFDCLCQATDDYTTTTNGDIGRFTRRAAIQTIGKLLPLAFNKQKGNLPVISQNQLDLAIGKIIERACESIDDLRVVRVFFF